MVAKLPFHYTFALKTSAAKDNTFKIKKINEDMY